jgi:hypothetical protein
MGKWWSEVSDGMYLVKGNQKGEGQWSLRNVLVTEPRIDNVSRAVSPFPSTPKF